MPPDDGLHDGFHDVPPGHLATVVTHLEMRDRVAPRAERAQVPWTLRRVERADLGWYRALFRHVGAEWLWSSRLTLTDEILGRILHHHDVEVHALTLNGRDEGLLELDFRVPRECELAYFGLSAALVGRGAGRWLMNRAIEGAWARDIGRFWLHTCTLDAPAALGFYRRSGFVPYARQVEVFPDPRLQGVLPLAAGAHEPVIG